ncbi:MAG: HEAT repeat domain-containing protein [Acidobacteriota bacterium]
MECRKLTELALDGRLSDAPGPLREEVAAHAESCSACRSELETLEHAWDRLGDDPDLPVTPEFRRRTLALLEDEMLRSRIRTFTPRRGRRWTRPLLEAAAVLVAAITGYGAARQLSPSSSLAPSRAAASAAVPARLEKAGALANVAYRPPDAQGRIGVSFDVTSRETVLGRPDDPQMARLIAFLVSRGAQTAGEKSRAIDLVSANYGVKVSPASPDIVLALTNTLKKDQNPGVRKKAADALAGFRMTPEIRAAFLEALRSDRHPGVRLVAVEALAAAAKDSPDRKTIESLREKAFDPAENGFVRARAASALKGIEF